MRSLKDRLTRKALAVGHRHIGPDGERCWLWKGYKDAKGYGQVRVGERAMWAHRVSYELFRGPIPAGRTVHHECNNPSCINPAHLTLATRAENTAEGNYRNGYRGIVRTQAETKRERRDPSVPRVQRKGKDPVPANVGKSNQGRKRDARKAGQSRKACPVSFVSGSQGDSELSTHCGRCHSESVAHERCLACGSEEIVRNV